MRMLLGRTSKPAKIDTGMLAVELPVTSDKLDALPSVIAY